MKKVTQLILMLCFILSGAFCYASSVAGQENKKGKDEICALQLVPKVLVLGVGCRKGVSAGQIEPAFVRFCAERSILPQSVAAAASIDRKQHESGLLSFCAQRELPLHFFPAEALAAVPGSFSASSFVLDTVGVDNVCERSAALLSGGPLLEKKYAENGVSLALALRPPQFNWNWK